MCVHAHARTCTWARMCVYVCMRIFVWVCCRCVFVCVCVCVWACAHACAHACECACVCMYICVCLCGNLCRCLCDCVFVSVWCFILKAKGCFCLFLLFLFFSIDFLSERNTKCTHAFFTNVICFSLTEDWSILLYVVYEHNIIIPLLVLSVCEFLLCTTMSVTFSAQSWSRLLAFVLLMLFWNWLFIDVIGAMFGSKQKDISLLLIVLCFLHGFIAELICFA